MVSSIFVSLQLTPLYNFGNFATRAIWRKQAGQLCGYMISRLIGLWLSDRPSIPVRTKVESYQSSDHFGCRFLFSSITSHQISWGKFFPSSLVQTAYSTVIVVGLATGPRHRIKFKLHSSNCPVGWGYRIDRLLFRRGIRHPTPYERPGYDIKQSDGKIPVMLEFWECRVPLYYHCSPVHSGLEWQHQIRIISIK